MEQIRLGDESRIQVCMRYEGSDKGIRKRERERERERASDDGEKRETGGK